MGLVSTGARVLDRLLPDETEALSFLALVRHKA
jgi:predicted RNA polymerase sigma factor